MINSFNELNFGKRCVKSTLNSNLYQNVKGKMRGLSLQEFYEKDEVKLMQYYQSN